VFEGSTYRIVSRLPTHTLPQPRCLLHRGPQAVMRERQRHGICAENCCCQQQRAKIIPSSSPHLLIYQRVLMLLLLLLLLLMLPQRQRHILLFSNGALCRTRPPRTKRENRMRALCLAPRHAGADRRHRIRGQ
jgi:hypothetical protein